MNLSGVNEMSGVEFAGRRTVPMTHGDRIKVAGRGSDSVAPAHQPQPLDSGAVTASGEPESSPPPNGRAAGVLRLLEAGHFRGVAAVRLRINFHEELAARAMERARPVMDSHAETLIESITTRVADLTATATFGEAGVETVEALTSRFAEDVRATVAEAAEGSTIDGEALSTALKSAFEGLVGELGALLSEKGPEEEPGTDGEGATSKPDSSVLKAVEAVPVLKFQPRETVVPETPVSVKPIATQEAVLRATIEPAGTPTVEAASIAEEAGPTSAPAEPAPEEPMAALTAAFDEAVVSLLGAIEQAMRIPEPAAPHGHGRAYDKFMALYQALYSGGETIEQQA